MVCHARAFLLSLALLLAGCAGSSAASGPDGGRPDQGEPPADTRDVVADTGPGPAADAVRDGVADGLLSDDAGADAGSDAGNGSATVTFVLLHTSDEHGHIAPSVDEDTGTEYGGAANVLGMWNALEPADAPRLVLSSGDSWYGAAISSWFDGAPAAEAQALMGYDASAVGNHEFDLGLGVMADRVEQSGAAWLAANVVEEATDAPFALAEPWVVRDLGGVTVGLVGLANEATPLLTPADALAGLVFLSPADVLPDVVPEVRAAGADVVVVLAHAPFGVLQELPAAALEGVDMVFGGHQHQRINWTLHGVPYVESGADWSLFTRVTGTWDPGTGHVSWEIEPTAVSRTTATPAPYEPDAALAAEVATWEAALAEALGQTVGHLGLTIRQRSWLQANWVTDAWLAVVPEADIALTNSGGLRAAVGPGAFARRDVVEMMPFDNEIVRVTLTGAQLRDQLARGHAYCTAPGGPGCFVAVAGLRYEAGGEGLAIVLDDGAPLSLAATYAVLVNDFMYEGGAGFTFAEDDPDPWLTGLNYRDPVITWTEELATDVADALDRHLDAGPRDRVAYGRVIGFVADGAALGGWALASWIADAWRSAGEADVALGDPAALAFHLNPGPVAVGDVAAVLAADPPLVRVATTAGAIAGLVAPRADEGGGVLPIAGVTYSVAEADGAVTLHGADGAALSPDAPLTLATTEALATALDAAAEDTAALGTTGRAAVVAWTEALETTEAQPLDDHLDPTPRRREW